MSARGSSGRYRRAMPSGCWRLTMRHFLDELQDAFGYRLGALSRVGKRAAYPLILSKAARLTATRGVLVGNAAHGLHPVAAQGFNLGLRDVAALCDCIADACTLEFDPGYYVQRYAAWRSATRRSWWFYRRPGSTFRQPQRSLRERCEISACWVLT